MAREPAAMAPSITTNAGPELGDIGGVGAGIVGGVGAEILTAPKLEQGLAGDQPDRRDHTCRSLDHTRPKTPSLPTNSAECGPAEAKCGPAEAKCGPADNRGVLRQGEVRPLLRDGDDFDRVAKRPRDETYGRQIVALGHDQSSVRI